jgi:hypothetical protein
MLVVWRLQDAEFQYLDQHLFILLQIITPNGILLTKVEC